MTSNSCGCVKQLDGAHHEDCDRTTQTPWMVAVKDIGDDQTVMYPVGADGYVIFRFDDDYSTDQAADVRQ